MKRFLSLLFTVIIIFSMSAVCVFADETTSAEIAPVSEAATLGTDGEYLINNEGLITEGTAAEINRLCSGVYVYNKCKICIYVVSTFGAETPSACADRIYTENIPQNDDDFGLVFVCAITDGKYHLKCGSGLDGQFSDEDAKKILSESFEPLFANGEYDNSFYALTNELTNKLGNAIPHKTDTTPTAKKIFLIILIVVLIIVFLAVVAFLILYIRAERIRRQRRMRNAQNRSRSGQNSRNGQVRRPGRR